MKGMESDQAPRARKDYESANPGKAGSFRLEGIIVSCQRSPPR